MDANSAGSMGVIKVLIYVNLWMPFPLVGGGGVNYSSDQIISCR